ncbi:MAG: hypothetical protein IIZ27_09580 [Solobacterium sp.]|nr:hypothetical protein [Solobacterium sp.]
MAYATVEDVEKGFRELDADEEEKCEALLDEADVLIDAVASSASADAKKVVECRMVRRALGDGSSGNAFPLGSTQGSISALGYSQSWTVSGGSTGELYIGKTERQILGLGNKIGVTDPYGVSE